MAGGRLGLIRGSESLDNSALWYEVVDDVCFFLFFSVFLNCNFIGILNNLLKI